MVAFDAEGEALVQLERAFESVRGSGHFGGESSQLVIDRAVAGVVVAVKDVPVNESAVAAQVDLAGGDPAHGHPDRIEIRSAVPRAVTAFGQTPDPVGVQFLVEGDEMIFDILGGERAGRSRGKPGGRQRGHGRAHPFEETATVDAGRAGALEVGRIGLPRV